MTEEIIDKELEAKSEVYSRCGNATLNIPKVLIRNLGLTTAAFLESMITKEKYFFERNMLTDDGYFWNVEEDRQDDCGLSPYQQNQALLLLQNLNIIKIKRAGMPYRQYFKISYQKFKDLLSKFQAQDLKNLRSIYNKNKDNKNKDNKSISKDIDKVSRKPNNISFSIQTVSRRNKPLIKYTHNPQNISKEVENRNNHPNYKKPPKNKKIHIKKDDWRFELIKEWNKIPQVTKHTKMDTGVAFNISRYLNYLLNGCFFNQCKVNKDYFKWNKIPLEWINQNKSFSKRQIFNAIKDFSKDFLDGYYPKNKKVIPTSLETFLFNTNTGSSWFLKCVANPDPKPIHEENQNKDPNPQYTKFFKQRNLLKDFSEKDYKKIYNGIRAIENRAVRDELFYFNNGSNPTLLQKIGRGPGQLEPMFENYAKFLSGEYNFLNPDEIFKPYYGYFDKFLIYLDQTYSSFKVNL